MSRSADRTRFDAGSLRRHRIILGLTVAAVVVLQVVMAMTTLGTEDVRRWTEFAASIAEVGPARVYSLTFDLPFNHPPLIAYLLWVVGGLVSGEEGIAAAIRIPAILSSAVTPFIVLELTRRRLPPEVAFAAAASVAVSPALFAISAFHGNTDTIAVMLSLLSVYLLVDRRAPAWSGLAIASAMSVKLVPIVVVPTLVVATWQAGPRFVRRFIGSTIVTLVAIWVPVLAIAWRPAIDGVLGYQGGTQSWGVVQLAGWVAGGDGSWLRGPGRWIAVVAALGPAWLAMRRPSREGMAAALAWTALLVLLTGFGVQYLAWAVAPAYLLHFAWATAFNVVVSILVFEVYTRWSGGLPWYVANSSAFTGTEIALAFLAWLVLVCTTIAGVRALRAASADLDDAKIGSPA